MNRESSSFYEGGGGGLVLFFQFYLYSVLTEEDSPGVFIGLDWGLGVSVSSAVGSASAAIYSYI